MTIKLSYGTPLGPGAYVYPTGERIQRLDACEVFVDGAQFLGILSAVVVPGFTEEGVTVEDRKQYIFTSDLPGVPQLIASANRGAVLADLRYHAAKLRA